MHPRTSAEDMEELSQLCQVHTEGEDFILEIHHCLVGESTAGQSI